jgi:CBS domain containing-hemolysin-like protein
LPFHSFIVFLQQATTSSEGILTGEGRMIKAVLDMQDKEVNKIMQPRVDIIALPEEASATQILQTAVQTKYSRIPVYRGDIDHIIGIVFSKDLLDYINIKSSPFNNTTNSQSLSSQFEFRPHLADDWTVLSAIELLEPTYYIPETMSCWNALQEMRKRRLHMAIVVDEYGGTSGLVTFEDILEEVVGEIYDEDDEVEQADDSKTIFKRSNGSFKMKGSAELDDVCEALGIDLDNQKKTGTVSSAGEYSTVSGLLCSIAGMLLIFFTSPT